MGSTSDVGGGEAMMPALRIIFQALSLGLQKRPEKFSKVHLHFIGTDYAPQERIRKTVEPVADTCGVGRYVEESPARIPYFEALQLLLDADFLLVPKSDDPQYTVSKIYHYIMSGKPLLGIFRANSSVVDIVRRVRAGTILPFRPEESVDVYVEAFYEEWVKILAALPFLPAVDWQAFTPYTAREMTRKQVELFDHVLRQWKGDRGSNAS
jgi:hypothetical protein